MSTVNFVTVMGLWWAEVKFFLNFLCWQKSLRKVCVGKVQCECVRISVGHGLDFAVPSLQSPCLPNVVNIKCSLISSKLIMFMYDHVNFLF